MQEPCAAMHDLHTHTLWSDGDLSPEALVGEAARAGVRVLAVTDHDTTQGIAAARAGADARGIVLVAGVEISVTWQGLNVHLVGLDIDVDNAALQTGLARLQTIRRDRARAIVEALARDGLGEARAALVRPGVVGRGHIADWLVANGHARHRAGAFKRFLARGASAYVPVTWASLEEGIAWIRAAGGCSVLAHPTRYDLSAGRLRQLIAGFAEAGGEALEVVSTGLQAGEIARLGRLAQHHRLKASLGSDYHKPLPWRSEPGHLPALPADCVPVWRDRARMQPA